MKSSTYYLARQARLQMLPMSKNIRRKLVANYRAMGAARQNELHNALAK